MHIPQAQTIDEVVNLLDEVLAHTRRERSRLGYFAALYRKVTVRIREGIHQGEFEDNPRMEQLDVNFANRYLKAVHQHWHGLKPARSWQLSFSACRDRNPTVLQHLLMGMNAHINLDVGIAAAMTSPGSDLPALQSDFNKINVVLASLVDDVKAELTQIWPLLGPLDEMAGITEDVMVNFSMEKARDHAWQTAEKIAPIPLDQQAPA